MSKLTLAIHRFGLGPRKGSLVGLKNPERWLLEQVRPEAAFMPTPRSAKSSGDLVRAFLRAREQGKTERKEMRKVLRTQYREDSLASLGWAARTEHPFAERWVQFWTNHFTVSITRKSVEGLTGAFEREAVRAHCFGRFEDLLLAVVRHPAMLVYLDNVRSVGPNSRAGRKQRGLNENLAREIMELHTLGVDGGYTEADVQAFAKVLTGWSLIRKHWMSGDVFRFREEAHEPGAKTILGRRYDAGEAGGVDFLKTLAHHRSTARFIARKLAVHFVSSDPPKGLVDRLSAAFSRSGGNLSVVARVLVEAPESWRMHRGKLKTPFEWVVGLTRGAGQGMPVERMLGAMRALGQVPFSAPSPKGWPEREEEWMGPEAMLSRLDVAERFGRMMARNGGVGSDEVDQWLGPKASKSTRSAIQQAANPAHQWALLAMSPEFQRR